MTAAKPGVDRVYVDALLARGRLDIRHSLCNLRPVDGSADHQAGRPRRNGWTLGILRNRAIGLPRILRKRSTRLRDCKKNCKYENPVCRAVDHHCRSPK